MRTILLAIVLALLISCLVLGCGGNTETITPESATDVEASEKKDQGDSISDLEYLEVAMNTVLESEEIYNEAMVHINVLGTNINDAEAIAGLEDALVDFKALVRKAQAIEAPSKYEDALTLLNLSLSAYAEALELLLDGAKDYDMEMMEESVDVLNQATSLMEDYTEEIKRVGEE